MPFHNPSFIDLAVDVANNNLENGSLKQLQKYLHNHEQTATEADLGYCLFMVDPAQLIYTSDLFTRQTGLEVNTGQTLPLENWLQTWPECFNLHQPKELQYYLDKLKPTSNKEREKHLVLLYTDAKLKVHMEEKIKPMALPASTKSNIYWCWKRSLPHLEAPFSYTLNLVQDTQVIEKLYHCPPLFEHPKLKTLSPAERKVMHLLLHTDNSRTIAEKLHMSPETVKSHRRHIIGKTGFDSTDALVAVIKRDMGI
jgi:DNA-binding CsgD family transcriptional regulator